MVAMNTKLVIATLSVILVYEYVSTQTPPVKNKDVKLDICVPPNASLPIKITCSAKVKSKSSFDNLYWLECDNNISKYDYGSDDGLDYDYGSGSGGDLEEDDEPDNCIFPKSSCCNENYKRIKPTKSRRWNHELKNTLVIRNITEIKPIFKCVYTSSNPSLIKSINVTKFINEGDPQGYRVCKRYDDDHADFVSKLKQLFE
ncbi:hypothetical protein [Pteropox virus]|uniref:Uncharacterized protein n=1 Tax=Pteropox virus TaxID=1873698 RepID=A0A1B1MRK6_9POXV|nr:hypothetical protein [Pteropox virus]ANS71224.1 hypothetical protein [Pteropox virus]